MKKLDTEQEIAITTIIYDVFAYRVGPDEWNEAYHEFYVELTKLIE